MDSVGITKSLHRFLEPIANFLFALKVFVVTLIKQDMNGESIISQLLLVITCISLQCCSTQFGH